MSPQPQRTRITCGSTALGLRIGRGTEPTVTDDFTLHDETLNCR